MKSFQTEINRWNHRQPYGVVRLLCSVVWLTSTASLTFSDEAKTDFEKSISGILVRRCLECHNSINSSGGLDLSRHDKLLAGGDSGEVVVSGKPEESSLIERIAAGEMPPEKNGKKQELPAEEIDVLRQWVAEGGAWPEGRILDPYERTTEKRSGRDWWSLQPLTHPEVPEDGSDSTIAIDAFIRAGLKQRQLTAAPPAEKRTLLRRVYYDVIGLPPTADEIEAFVADTSPDAYERVVDALLERPQFGERWARHWLDVVRFAETNGYERDAVKPNAWKYRDWVIQAFNSDMPYDEFVKEQLAGDELPNRSEETVIATGFLRLGTWDDEPNDVEEYKYDRLEDLVHTTTTAFLGMTVKCARCHDHKFDAIPQTDYYRIGAAFWGGPVTHRARELQGGPTKEELGFDVLGWTDITKEPAPLNLLKKGDVHRPGPEVDPGSLTGTVSFVRDFEKPAAEAKTTQRRLQLAEWIASADNPLTSRVIVNRIWQHYYGDGIVASSDNFGFLGEKPSHPELLDWLANELIGGKWKLKRLHKMMVMSETYRQSSLHPDADKLEEIDLANRYLWRGNRRRLDAESLRDTILTASGRLDLKLGGPSFHAPISNDALEGLSMKSGAYQPSPPEETRRRSIYMFTKRGLGVPLMTVFDTCDTTAPTGRRDVTIVPTQALSLLNNGWVNDEAHAMSRRVLETSATNEGRVKAAWRYALGRDPGPVERSSGLAHVGELLSQPSERNSEENAWASLCHVLINSNEFIYVD